MSGLKALTTPLPPKANATVTIALMLGVALLVGNLFLMGGPTKPLWLWIAQMVWFGGMIGAVIWQQIKVLAARPADVRSPSDGGPRAS